MGFSSTNNGQLTVHNQGSATLQVTSRIEQAGAGSGVEEQRGDVAPGATVTAFGGDGNVYLPLIQR